MQSLNYRLRMQQDKGERICKSKVAKLKVEWVHASLRKQAHCSKTNEFFEKVWQTKTFLRLSLDNKRFRELCFHEVSYNTLCSLIYIIFCWFVRETFNHPIKLYDDESFNMEYLHESTLYSSLPHGPKQDLIEGGTLYWSLKGVWQMVCTQSFSFVSMYAFDAGLYFFLLGISVVKFC